MEQLPNIITFCEIALYVSRYVVGIYEILAEFQIQKGIEK